MNGAYIQIVNCDILMDCDILMGGLVYNGLHFYTLLPLPTISHPILHLSTEPELWQQLINPTFLLPT